MKVSEIFHGENLKADDLKGKEVNLTIDGWALMDFDDGKKLQLRFRETDRCLIVNKTNANAIADMLGDDTDAWVGGRVCLFPTKTDFGGKRVDCIRVKEAVPAKGVVVPVEVDESEVPF